MSASQWLLPQQLFDGSTLHHGMAVRVEGGVVAELAPQALALKSRQPATHLLGTLSPGFFDIQVNGGAGKMFNSEPCAATLAHVGAALRAAGTTAWLPTFITDAPGRLPLAAEAVAQTLGRHGVAGIHIEGPHISPERRGAHRAEWVRPIDEASFATLAQLRQKGVPVLLTLAPECQPPGTVARLCAMGVVVSLGHTAADARQVNAALAEGARCFTHLFNGMTPMTSREPGVVGAALDSPAWCGLIADGHHVADAVLRVAIRSRPRSDRMVLVSDAMATTHGPDQFDLYGETIQVVDGRLINQAGSLAGAHIDLAACVQRLIQTVGVPATQALPMATRHPAELMDMANSTGHIRVGAKADLLLLDTEWRVQRVL